MTTATAGVAPSTVGFGIHLMSVNPKVWVPICEEADRLGFESVWIPEHLVLPVAGQGSPHAGADHPPIQSNIPVFDALLALSHIAARTTTIKLGTNVYNIGLRHPFITARAAATLDFLSKGRLALGIGASWMREEWDAVDLDFDTRGARVDETIEICQRLWTEEVVEHHGRFFDFGPVAFEPKPIQKPLALHIGGDGAAALRRAATVGSGWMPMNHALADLPASLVKLRELSDRAGRTRPVEITFNGDVEKAADVDKYAAVGINRLIVTPWASSREAVDGMKRFHDNVIAPLRQTAS